MFYRIEFLYNSCLNDIQQLQAIIESKSKELKDIKALNRWLINNQLNYGYKVFKNTCDALHHADNINIENRKVYTLFINPKNMEIYILKGVALFNNVSGEIENIDFENKKKPELNISKLF